MHVIYKKQDRSIVGSVFPRRDQRATNIALSVELENILASELGGKAEDYSYIEVNQINQQGLVPEITENMEVVFKPSPRSVDRERAIGKLKKLGLTLAEIEAIT